MTIEISNNAIASVTASLANPSKGYTEAELKFKEWAAKPTWKNARHEEAPSPEYKDAIRLYTITTMACGARFGGNRTPVICTSFDIAREYAEKNMGDLYECSYTMLVIEAVAANRPYPMLSEMYWYRWDGTVDGDNEYGRYREIETPDGFEGRGGVQPIG